MQSQLPLPSTVEEAKKYFKEGPVIPLGYDTITSGEPIERNPETMRTLWDLYYATFRNK